MPVGYERPLSTPNRKNRRPVSRAVFIAGILLFIVLLFGIGFYVENRQVIRQGSETTTTWINTKSESPIRPVAKPDYKYGTRLEIEPVEGVKGFYITAYRDGYVRGQRGGYVHFDNQSNQAVFIGGFGFGCVLSDGSSHGAITTDHWGVILQPGENYDAYTGQEHDCTLDISKIDERGETVIVARWE